MRHSPCRLYCRQRGLRSRQADSLQIPSWYPAGLNRLEVVMKSSRIFAGICVVIVSAAAVVIGQDVAQSGQGSSKKEHKQVDKDARKLGDTAEEAADHLGRNVVFCILDAHTDVGTAQELRSKFESLHDFPFGQFVAAVLMADRTDIPLDDIIAKLEDGMSLGQIAKEAKSNMGEIRSGFGQMRSELARLMTNPPTRDCFQAN